MPKKSSRGAAAAATHAADESSSNNQTAGKKDRTRPEADIHDGWITLFVLVSQLVLIVEGAAAAAGLPPPEWHWLLSSAKSLSTWLKDHHFLHLRVVYHATKGLAVVFTDIANSFGMGDNSWNPPRMGFPDAIKIKLGSNHNWALPLDEFRKFIKWAHDDSERMLFQQNELRCIQARAFLTLGLNLLVGLRLHLQPPLSEVHTGLKSFMAAQEGIQLADFNPHPRYVYKFGAQGLPLAMSAYQEKEWEKVKKKKQEKEATKAKKKEAEKANQAEKNPQKLLSKRARPADTEEEEEEEEEEDEEEQEDGEDDDNDEEEEDGKSRKRQRTKSSASAASAAAAPTLASGLLSPPQLQVDPSGSKETDGADHKSDKSAHEDANAQTSTKDGDDVAMDTETQQGAVPILVSSQTVGAVLVNGETDTNLLPSDEEIFAILYLQWLDSLRKVPKEWREIYSIRADEHPTWAPPVNYNHESFVHLQAGRVSLMELVSHPSHEEIPSLPLQTNSMFAPDNHEDSDNCGTEVPHSGRHSPFFLPEADGSPMLTDDDESSCYFNN